MHAIVERILVVVDQRIDGLSALLQRFHRLTRVAEHLLALGIQNAIGVAHQRGGLLQRCRGLLANKRKLFERLGNIATLARNGRRRLFKITQRFTKAVDVFRREQFVGVVQQHIDVGNHVGAIGEQARNGRGRGNNHGQLAVFAFERWAVGVTPAELDDRGSRYTGQCQFGLGVDLDGRVGGQANQCQNPTRVFVIEAQFNDIAYLDAVVLHRTAFGQAADSLVEHHFVVLEGVVHARFGQPQAKQHAAHHDQNGEQANQYMMGAGFHVNAPCAGLPLRTRRGHGGHGNTHESKGRRSSRPR